MKKGIEITLLSEDLLENSVVMRENGKKARGTDLANDMERYHGLFMPYWLLTKAYSDWTYKIWSNVRKDELAAWLGLGVRPIIKFSMDFMNNIEEIKGIVEVEYGEYFLDLVSSDVSQKLELNLLNAKLQPTGKVYSIIEHSVLEYMADGIKYCCFKNKWYKVRPMKWLVDEENQVLISKEVLFGNMPIDRHIDFSGQFESSELYYWLNDVFINEILPNKVLENKDKCLFQLKDNLQAEYEKLQEENKKKEQLLTEIQALKEAISFEREKASLLDKKIMEVSQIIAKTYVKK